MHISRCKDNVFGLQANTGNLIKKRHFIVKVVVKFSNTEHSFDGTTGSLQTGVDI